MGKNKSLALGIVYAAIPIPQQDAEPVTIWVRGLSPSDIAAVMQDDGGQGLAQLYTDLTTGQKSPDDALAIGLSMVDAMPDLCAKIIARAADLPEEWENVINFATGAQVELLQKIATLTFQSDTLGKKLMEIVKRFFKEGQTPAQPDLPPISTPGSGD